jgi:hypothetical protein
MELGEAGYLKQSLTPLNPGNVLYLHLSDLSVPLKALISTPCVNGPRLRLRRVSLSAAIRQLYLSSRRSLWREQSRFRILSRCEISTSHELVNLLPPLAEGGVLIVDDYGA